MEQSGEVAASIFVLICIIGAYLYFHRLIATYAWRHIGRFLCVLMAPAVLGQAPAPVFNGPAVVGIHPGTPF